MQITRRVIVTSRRRWVGRAADVLRGAMMLALPVIVVVSAAAAVPPPRQPVESARQTQRSEAEHDYEQAKQARVDSHRKLAEAQERFDAFLQRSYEAQPTPSTLNETAEVDPAASGSTPGQSATQPAQTAINPEWLAMRRRLDYARQHREQLLVERTPLHPMVRAADEEIADLERRLAEIPHELVSEQGDLDQELLEMTDPLPEPPGLKGPPRDDVDLLDQPLGRFTPPGARRPRKTTDDTTQPDRGPESSPSSVAARQAPPSSAARQAPPFMSEERLREFLEFRRELASLEESYRQGVEAERTAWQRLAALPPVESIGAKTSVDVGTPVHDAMVAADAAKNGSPTRRTIGSLLVALIGAAGVGMAVSGVSSGATFTNVARARAALPVPVLATLPAADPADLRSSRRRRIDATVKVVGGAVLVIACAGVLLSAIS
ncbi:MAG TPA: hypothetical protein DD670_10810 [Planctomycetaceae bacterium]|nr:hypothetical protein [Planctomycetaceae bacterium]